MKKIIIVSAILAMSSIIACNDIEKKDDNIGPSNCVVCEGDSSCVDLNRHPSNCGKCGHSCKKLPNAVGVCNGSGECIIEKCESGYADCDGRLPQFDPNTPWVPLGKIVQSGQDNGCEFEIVNGSNQCSSYNTQGQ